MLISALTDKELLRVFSCSCRHIAKAKRKNDKENLAHYMEDSEYIMAEVDKRLPKSYKWEVEQIAKGEPIAKVVRPGDLYKHNKIAFLQIQIVDEHDFNGPLWSCRLFITGAYVCRFIVKQSTILNHFTRVS